MKLPYVIFAFILFLNSLHASELQGYLKEEEIALFYKQGYLLKRNCLTKTEIENLNEDVSIAIARALDEIRNSKELSYSDDDQMIYIDGSRIVCKKRTDQSISIARINGCAGMEPKLLAVIRSEKMVRTFFEILGTNELEHLISQIHPKLPGDGISYPRHRDIQFRKSFDPEWQDILGNGSYAICIIPIDPMTPENGGLWIDQNNYPEPQGLQEDLVWIYAEPGDILFMHPYLYHGSGPNSSQESRKTLLTGFCAYGANHKAYPGAQVNTHLVLSDEKITIAPAPWSKDNWAGSGIGH
jgi:ectoine hydroxylase-related dioxygenase (phytanoyl-CoA dioxygenase family)